MNKDRVRVIARQWKYLILPVAMIAVVTWVLIPGGSARPGLAQPKANPTEQKLQLVKHLGDNKAYADLIEMALHNPDAELQRLAAIRLTELEGEISPDAMIELYNRSRDPVVRKAVINSFGRRNEIKPLTRIALSEQFPEHKHLALSLIKWMKQSSNSADIKSWDVSALQDQLDKLGQPPPPPPGEEMTVEAGKPLTSTHWQKDKDSVVALLREAADASIRRDTSFFERILDEDYLETGPSGETMNKAQAIADVKRMDQTISKFEFNDLSVSGSEHMAFATFLGTVYFQANGQDSTLQYRYTINFINRDGQLKIAAIHMSRKQ